MDIIERILEKFQIKPLARQVYIDLVEHGGATARLIATRLSLTRPSVYDQLKVLIHLGLVVEKDKDGKTVFAIHDIADLGRLMNEEKKQIDGLEREFKAAEANLSARTHTVEPKIKFISDRDGIVQSMHDMLWDDSLCIKVVWPYTEMLRVLGKQELLDFNAKRIRQGIELRTIWPDSSMSQGAHIWESGDEGVDRRVAPKGFLPRMGYTIYGDKVLFVSSARETFGFTVQSQDFAELMSLQFDLLWDISGRETSSKKKVKKISKKI